MPFSTLHPAPSRFRSTLPALAAAALLSALAAPPAVADILVMKDGTQVVTDGPWTAKGRQIVFTLPNGQLSAVRASEVDVARSEQATREAAAPPKPAAPSPEEVAAQQARKKPVLVLTDKDIKQAEPDATAESPAAAGRATALEVVDGGFDSLQGDPAFRIVGAVVNSGTNTAQGVRVIATLSGQVNGQTRRVYCESALEPPLAPGDRADFVCDVSRRDIDETGLAQAFAEPQVTFEVRAAGSVRPDAQPGVPPPAPEPIDEPPTGGP